MRNNILPLLIAASALGLCQFTTTANDIEPGKETYDATRVTKPITLDGNMADWAGVPVLADPKFAIPKASGSSGRYVLFEEYSGGTWSGPDDQTSAVQVAWDADNVYLGFVVTDDYHENVSGNAWNGDSVQIMIANSGRTARVALYNYALLGYEDNQGAFVDQGGVLVHHQSGAVDADPTPGTTEGVVARDGVKKKTIYEIKFPAAALGLTPPLTAGIKFGLGMAINDGDGALVDGVQYGQAGQQGQKGWGGLGAHSIVFGKTASETALVTLSPNAPTVDRLFFSAINPGVSAFTFRATDKGASVVDPASAKLTIDGKTVTLTSKKTGEATDFTYSAATAFPPGSDHTYTIEVKDTQGNVVTDSGSFKTRFYLTGAIAVQPDTSKPGFLVRTWKSPGQPNSIAWTEDQLAGLHGDNTADVSLFTDKQFGNSYFDETGTINYWNSSGQGNFTNNDTQNTPGLANDGTDDNSYSLEIITFLELPAGETTMGVNSDDGFRVYSALSPNPIDAFAPILGEFDAGRGVGDTTFTVVAEKAGVYPFRMIYEEGGGGSAVEWFTVKPDGTKVLINDTANGGLKAYRGIIGGYDPSIKLINPSPAPRQLARVSSSVSVVLSDGDTKKVDDKSIVLKVDGAAVTPTVSRQGGTVTVTYTPSGLQFPQDKHTADLTFKDTTGALTRNQSWTFYGLKNLVLPAPKILETFDTYPEDSQPTGWVATNFSSRGVDGRDITNQNSESYENWVLVKTENLGAIDGGDPFHIAPGLTYNGKEIKNSDPVGGTFPEWLMSGNVLYAESDGRSNTDALDRGYEGQAQFIVSKPFDCSQINDVVLTFSSIYTQNQDSLGAVEYSVDQGKTWLPIVYFLDGPDIKLNGDGTVDALRTFNDANTDTANWKVNDVVKGDKYGDGIGAAITADLGPYIVPRVNDDQVEGKRVEMFRLPAASKKADVRLRFAQLGTDSWFFAVDNIAFYDVPAPVTTKPTLAIALSAGKVSITWSAGKLQAADSVTGPWTDVANAASPLSVTPSGTKFYRASG
ncbi:MAG: hypothetical protein HY735_02420, partial [Verrucomicrobia bacterium]|nr:hypothetical protein [Verrucomicrobiota bacterium]